MFFGSTLQQGVTLSTSSLEGQGDILHLSHINLNTLPTEGKTSVFLLVEGQKLPIAHLNNENHSVNLDLYVRTSPPAVFSVQGKGQVSLLGYFPPNNTN